MKAINWGETLAILERAGKGPFERDAFEQITARDRTNVRLPERCLEGGRKEEQLGTSLIHSASDEKDLRFLLVSKVYECIMSCLGLHAQV